jgi:hypothetical protein
MAHEETAGHKGPQNQGDEARRHDAGRVRSLPRHWDPNSYRVCYKCGDRGELLLDTPDTPESAYNR